MKYTPSGAYESVCSLVCVLSWCSMCAFVYMCVCARMHREKGEGGRERENVFLYIRLKCVMYICMNRCTVPCVEYSMCELTNETV